MSFPIGKEVVERTLDRLADVTFGFNATYNALAPGYGIDADMAIEFTAADDKSQNFALADVDPEEWQKTGSTKFPLVTLFSGGGQNQNAQKFHQFSGDVPVGINVFLSWRETRFKLSKFEPTAWCVEEAMVTVINRARNAFQGDQDWGDAAVYNGDINWVKSGIKRGAQMFLQQIAFRLTFEVNQKGTT